MWENFVFLAIYDTCDVVYNWSISLLPPIVLDNLFAQDKWGSDEDPPPSIYIYSEGQHLDKDRKRQE